MANLILHTEDFLDAEWTNSNLTLTANFAAKPADLTPNARAASKFDDPSAAVQTNLLGTFYDVPANSTVVGSLFVQKDAVTSRQPSLAVHFVGGVAKLVGIILNTSTGVASVPTGDGSAPTAFGVIDYDAIYWRVWVKQTDVDSNVSVRLIFSPANYDNFGDFSNAAATGSIVGGYVNLVVAAVVGPYEPGPNYLTDYSIYLQEPVVGSSVF